MKIRFALNGTAITLTPVRTFEKAFVDRLMRKLPGIGADMHYISGHDRLHPKKTRGLRLIVGGQPICEHRKNPDVPEFELGSGYILELFQSGSATEANTSLSAIGEMFLHLPYLRVIQVTRIHASDRYPSIFITGALCKTCSQPILNPVVAKYGICITCTAKDFILKLPS
ncbi:MAG: hypothetical protein V4576_01670 [Patescibacteria group bacterium]